MNAKMVSDTKSCLKLSLKLVNSILAVLGIAMIVYSVWMIRAWQRDAEESSPNDPIHTFPWFIEAFMGIGIILCVVAGIGHFAAATANYCCLTFYMVVIISLLLLEISMLADIFLNSDWEKDFPKDPSGRFEDFNHFVDSNIDVCKCIGLLILLAQGLSILLATVLRTLGTVLRINHDHDSSNDDASRLPLLNPPAQPLPYVVGEPVYNSHNEPNWKVVY